MQNISFQAFTYKLRSNQTYIESVFSHYPPFFFFLLTKKLQSQGPGLPVSDIKIYGYKDNNSLTKYYIKIINKL